MHLNFDFWDNYSAMLKVIVWKDKFIPPIWNNSGVPLRLINYSLSNSKVWTLMCRVNGEIEIYTVNIVWSERPGRISNMNKTAMVKLVNAYFDKYQDFLKGDLQE